MLPREHGPETWVSGPLLAPPRPPPGHHSERTVLPTAVSQVTHSPGPLEGASSACPPGCSLLFLLPVLILILFSLSIPNWSCAPSPSLWCSPLGSPDAWWCWVWRMRARCQGVRTIRRPDGHGCYPGTRADGGVWCPLPLWSGYLIKGDFASTPSSDSFSPWRSHVAFLGHSSRLQGRTTFPPEATEAGAGAGE